MLGHVLTLPPLRFGLLVRHSLPYGSGYWLDIPPLRFGLQVRHLSLTDLAARL